MDELIYKELKKGGFMRQVQNEKFSLRLRSVGGQINANQLQKVSEIADKYGQGYIHLTSRQGIEIPFIDFKDINSVKAELATVNLEPGACGPRVRTITACQGNAICGSGLIETSNLAKELDEKYFAKDLPHKFKIGITGCRNNCLKAEENDLGIKGGLKPKWDTNSCTYCGVCKAVCPATAIEINKETNELKFDENKCIYCGKCVKSCPTDAWNGEIGYIISFGGLFGNNIASGKSLLPLITDKETLFKVVDTTVEFFKENGNASERFKFTLDRVGIDKLKAKLEGVIK
ncbi:4Fe-4S binding protein [Clostridium chromiireducens]|uniref:4Fe-4S dicluster domain-containing protein n=1 Tax=Clostridium chromiireducens TaxID=225345 RepID=A0A1V4IM53_9CLOT|nr:4Fe-4S binding protein [Clostridium chromiireducens]MVX62492.1 4Fe-4S dicluster domain-containing protein [Clostridium chromiireducens]OPJ60924.1 anaerobic sulfite reductase subunit C [Clostridium chromiireducens]RII36309.1 4Fe-4S dicluster domain-containing protein [Clostridium chromiireducens]